MGLFARMRRRRQEKKALYRAAKVRAKATAKAEAKLEKQKEKYLRTTAKKVRKYDAKDLKARRQHEQQMAQAALKQIRARRFDAKTVARWMGAARLLVPALAPLVYRGITQLNNVDASPARSFASPESVSLNTPAYLTRIREIRQSLKKGVPDGFARDVEDRLEVLKDHVESSSSLPEERARDILASVSRDLTLIEAQIRTKRS